MQLCRATFLLNVAKGSGGRPSAFRARASLASTSRLSSSADAGGRLCSWACALQSSASATALARL
eukprot:11165384-Lingulodinium_polyedra.AAC.1